MGEQCVDAACNGWVFDQRRRVLWFGASVDHQRSAAAPMLLLDKRSNAVHIARRVAARERHPEEIVERPSGEIAVIDDDDEGESIDEMVERHGR